jgi:hypothetical protein
MSVALAGLVGALVVVVGAASGAPYGRAGRADLKVRSLTNPPASVERRGLLKSALRVANLGTRTARRSTVRGYLSRDSRRSSGDIPLRPARSVPQLKPGKATRRTVIARVPRNTSTGRWFLIACADAGRIVREANERNNCRTAARRTTVTAESSPPPPPPATPSPGAPPPIAGQGYTLRFDDQFNTLNRAVWDDHVWYDEPPPANAQYVQNGVLHLVARRSQGYEPTEVTTRSSGIRFKRGYFEARMKWTQGDGAWPAFWLLSYPHATNERWPQPACPNPDCLSSELDMFEGQGSEPNVFYGTIHRNSCGCYGVSNQQNDNNYQPVPVSLTQGFHTYAAKWTETTVSWYLDDQLLHSAPVYNSFNQVMFLLLQMWIGGWTEDVNPSTPDELHTEVDWVRVWQR